MLQSANDDIHCLAQEMPFNFTNRTVQKLCHCIQVEVMSNFYVANSGHRKSIGEKAAHKMTISRTFYEQL